MDLVRPMVTTDLDLILQWRNDPSIRQYMYTNSLIEAEEHKQWFEKLSADDGHAVMIFEAESKRIGFVQFKRNRISEDIADWGFYMSPEAKKGMGRRMATVSLEYAFNRLNFRKVCGESLVFNEKSIRYHQSLGFQIEGILREQYYDGVEFHDVICFGLFFNEWMRND